MADCPINYCTKKKESKLRVQNLNSIESDKKLKQPKHA